MPAKRAYGMDQQFYPWSPIVTRPVVRWPDNARVALAVIVNLEHWDWEGGRRLRLRPRRLDRRSLRLDQCLGLAPRRFVHAPAGHRLHHQFAESPDKRGTSIGRETR